MVTQKMLTIGVLILSMVSCKDKPPFVPDYEIAIGSVIGAEDCKSDQTKNAWLIQLPGPNAGNKVYGDPINYKGVSYTNVVKTFSLPDSSKIPGKRYALEFYLEGKSLSQTCDAVNPSNFNITKISLKSLNRVAN